MEARAQPAKCLLTGALRALLEPLALPPSQRVRVHQFPSIVVGTGSLRASGPCINGRQGPCAAPLAAQTDSGGVQVYSAPVHSASVNGVAFAPHELGLLLAAASSDGSLSVLVYQPDGTWVPEKARPTLPLPGLGTVVACSLRSPTVCQVLGRHLGC